MRLCVDVAGGFLVSTGIAAATGGDLPLGAALIIVVLFMVVYGNGLDKTIRNGVMGYVFGFL